MEQYILTEVENLFRFPPAQINNTKQVFEGRIMNYMKEVMDNHINSFEDATFFLLENIHSQISIAICSSIELCLENIQILKDLKCIIQVSNYDEFCVYLNEYVRTIKQLNELILTKNVNEIIVIRWIRLLKFVIENIHSLEKMKNCNTLIYY